MNEQERETRNERKLKQLHPAFRQKIAAVIEDLEGYGYRPRIQDAWRSSADQKKVWESGHSKLLWGFHNATAPDGTPEALAVDLLDDDRPFAPDQRYLMMLASSAEAHDLTTGITWGLGARLRDGLEAAILRGDWSANVKMGWDPCHVQITGISVAQARKGARPGAAVVVHSPPARRQPVAV